MLREMPHIEASVSIDGERLEAIDLRIERYPIPAAEKTVYFKAFKTAGLVGRTKHGEWMCFKEDSVALATDEEVSSMQHLPDDWETHAFKLTEVFAPSLREAFMRG